MGAASVAQSRSSLPSTSATRRSVELDARPRSPASFSFSKERHLEPRAKTPSPAAPTLPPRKDLMDTSEYHRPSSVYMPDPASTDGGPGERSASRAPTEVQGNKLNSMMDMVKDTVEENRQLVRDR